MRGLIIYREILRSTFRRKGLSIALILSITLSIAILSAVFSINASVELTLTYSSDKYNEADIIIWSQGKPFNDTVRDIIKNIRGVIDVELKIREFGSIIAENSSSHAVIFGIEKNPKINKVMVDDAVWNQFQGNVCIVEKSVANKLGIHVGTTLKLLFYGASIDASVIALSDTPWIIASGSPITLAVYIPIDLMRSLKNMSEEYNYAEIKIDQDYSQEGILQTLLGELKKAKYVVDGTIVRKIDIRNVSSAIINLFFVLTLPILLITFIIALISNYSNIINEFREIGIKSAIGYTDMQIFKSYLFRNLILMVIGSVLGTSIGCVMSYQLNILIVQQQLGVLKFSYPLAGVIYSIMLVLVSILTASILPTYKLLKSSPIKIMKSGLTQYGVRSHLIKYRINLLLIIAIRNLNRKRIRTTLVLLLVIVTNLNIAIFNNVARNFSKTYVNVIESNYAWDIALGSLELFNSSLLHEIEKLEKVKIVEPQIWYWVPKRTLTILHLSLIHI